ncbi:MAG: protein phosphatase CheZ [Acidobacteriota bacterium]
MMMAMVEKEDWNELIQMLRNAEKNVPASGTGSAENYKASKQALQSFHTTAAMLGLPDLEQAGIQLEQYFSKNVETAANAETSAVFGFAVSALLEEMQNGFKPDSAPVVHIGEVMEILGVEGIDGIGTLTEDELPGSTIESAAPEAPAVPQKAPEAAVESAPAGKSIDLARLQEIVSELGGEVSMDSKGDGYFSLRFHATPTSINQIETLLSAGAQTSPFAPNLSTASSEEQRLDRVLADIKSFMVALSNSDFAHARDILLKLAEQQHQAGLYNEIGGLARELHNSLKGFLDTMDPALKEMVEERLPDSGNRLEHILELTENAANTTIDHVEQMQKQTEKAQEQLDRVEDALKRLKPIGEPAQKRIQEADDIVQELRAAAIKMHDDLLVVLTAQDYQDLTGQIIQKIIKLLKDLELKLVNVIRTFGAKAAEAAKKATGDELYGPAHKAKEEALHSQDDVDSLLAEFGF